MKSLNGRIVRCVVPVVFGLAIVGIAWWNYTQPPLELFGRPVLTRLKFKLGVDLVGGTILVYEVDPDKKPESYSQEDMVAALKRRLDPADLFNITIRPLSQTRIEIILPTGGRHQADAGEGRRALTEDDVERIKELIQRVGSLDFRILANKHDDEAAINASREFFTKAADSWKEFVTTVGNRWPDVKKEAGEKDKTTIDDVAPGDLDELTDLILRRNPKEDRATVRQYLRANFKPNDQLQALLKRAEAGMPPPAPEGPDGRTFKISLADGDHRVTYSWVEIGKSELHSLRLNNDARGGAIWQAAARARNDSKLFDNQAVGEEGHRVPPGTRGWETVIFSRKVLNKDRLSKKDRDDGKQIEYFFLTRDAEPGKEVTGKHLALAKEGMDDKGKIAVDFRFNTRGGNLFYELTTANKPESEDRGGGRRHLAITLDGQIMSAPSLNAVIRDSGQIHGSFTKVEVDTLVNILRAGALPATLKPQPVSENTMGATLGDDTIRAGTRSVGLSFLVVLAFMVAYYRFAGFVASVALLANLILTIAFMVVVNATFTLPGLAGLVLSVAMAVDANVLIYERLREERDKGASLALALRNGYDRSFATIIDTHLSSIFTGVVLYVVGNDQLKGFSVSLVAGLIISLFTSLYMTRTMFDVWLARGWLKQLSMGRLFSRTNIDFMAVRHYFFTASLLLTLAGGGLFLLRGKAGLNMDFVGGTVYSGQTTEFVVLSDPDRPGHSLRELLGEERQAERLALAKDPLQVEGDSNIWLLTYKEGGETRRVFIPEKVTPEQLRARAEVLPDVSLELIYHSSEELTSDAGSKLFTVRTTEKAYDVVASSISRLLGDKLQRTRLKGWMVERAVVVFPQPVALARAREVLVPALRKAGLVAGAAAPASPGAVGKAAAAAGGAAVAAAPKAPSPGDSLVTGREEVKKGQFRSVLITLTAPAEGDKLAAALASLAGGKEKSIESFQLDEARLVLDGQAYASQVRALLERELRSPSRSSLQVNVDGLVGDDRDRRYEEMQIKLSAPVQGEVFVQGMKSFGDALADRPLPVRLENFDSQLAAATQTRALSAILASWVALLFYVWFRFGNWTFGLAAILCLVHDILFTLGLVALCHYAFQYTPWLANALLLRDFKVDLPAVAALLTLVGYSINDKIVVYDRMREVRGKRPDLTPAIINDSINQALSRTMLTGLSVLLVLLVLFVFGGEGIHLFAFVMLIGLVVGTYSSVYVASPLLLIFGEGQRSGEARERAQRPAVTER